MRYETPKYERLYYSMKIRHLSAVCAACISLFSLLFPFLFSFLFSFAIFAAEDVVVNYKMEGNPRADLSNMKINLRIAEFTDGRSVDNPRLITDDNPAGIAEGGYQAEKEFAEIVQDAMQDGFANASARLVDAEEDMYLQGNLLSTEAQIIDRGGVETMQFTLRASVQLMSGSRTVWQTTLFGRGRTPASEDMAATVRAALDRLINELIGDDYFLAEIR